MSRVERIADLIASKREVDSKFRQELKVSMKAGARGELSTEERNALQSLLAEADARHLELWMIYSWARKANLSTASFTSWQTLLAARASTPGLRDPSWRLDDKRSAYRFADEIGVRRPWVDEAPLQLKDLSQGQPNTPFVLKPSSGQSSLGVYLAYSETRIVYVKTAKVLTTWQDFLIHANELLQSNIVSRDEWLREELICEDNDSEFSVAGRDYKFFTFYGEIHRIDEIVRFPEEQKDFYSGSGVRLDESPFRHWQGKRLQGHGVPTDAIEAVRSISERIPSPFMRIDMINGKQGMVLGEFTPAPGSAGQLKRGWDERLGAAYLRAENRLRRDLLNGKEFPAFRASSRTGDASGQSRGLT